MVSLDFLQELLIISEGAQPAFKRSGSVIKRYFRCTTGPKAGKLVSDPKLCGLRKHPKRVRAGRKVAREKKGVRIRKTAISKRTSLSKLLTRLNARIARNRGR